MTANDRGRLLPFVNIATSNILLHRTFLRLTFRLYIQELMPTNTARMKILRCRMQSYGQRSSALKRSTPEKEKNHVK